MTLFDWIHFTRPDWLLLIPIFWFFSRLIHFKPENSAIKSTVAAHLLPYLTNVKSSQVSQKWLGLTCISLLVIGLSGISFSKSETHLYTANQKTVFIVDQSLSLYATDIRPNRLTRVKQIMRDIINSSLEGDFALVAYAGDAYIVSPYTQDRETLTHFLVALDPLIMPIYGSNLADGLRQALTLVDLQDAPYTTFVVLTDDLKNKDVSLLSKVTQQHVALEVISIGTREGAPIKLPDGQTLRPQGITAIPKTPLDQIKQVTLEVGGHYYSHNSDINELEAIGQHALQTSDARSSDITGITWQEQGHWFALPFLVWLLWQFRSGGLIALVIIVLNPSTPSYASPIDWIKTNDQKAQQAVNQGDWESASKLFDDPRWKAASQYAQGSYADTAKTIAPLANSASDFYNLGNALAMSEDLPAALEAYKQALKLKPDFKEAKENLGYVQKQLEKQPPEENSDNTPKDDTDANSQTPQSDSDDQKSDNSNKDSVNSEQKQDNNSEKQDNQNPDQGSAQVESKTDNNSNMEEQQALEQWLRQIQDDPGTLLQRKLWYLHQERRNENRFKQEEGQQPW
ncbi:VWA domain-containing protein [Marinomonas atlantica]|uniref:VWA domain-containing protein n=1 Tax=Marinomonas atlantica TaxID=1806668 RepID=UPI00082FCBED|nr:VWA domain-containing protein [Marinomonas atlantica]